MKTRSMLGCWLCCWLYSVACGAMVGASVGEAVNAWGVGDSVIPWLACAAAWVSALVLAAFARALAGRVDRLEAELWWRSEAHDLAARMVEGGR
jgi:hypothetical protein